MCEHAQSCLTLFDHTDCRQLGSSVQGIFQARILGCHFLPPGDLPTQRSNLYLPQWQVDFFFLTTWVTWEAHFIHTNVYASVSISQSIRPPLPNLGVHALVLSDCVSMSTLQTKTTYAKHGEVESNSEESIRGITFIVPAPLSPESLLLVV